MFTFIVLISFIAYSYAHMCMLSPTQRPPIAADVNKPADGNCGLTTGPCGGRTPNEPGIQIRPAVPFTVVWQKNLDHWTASSPGYFSIDLAAVKNPKETDFKTLKQVPDTSAPSGTLYLQNVTTPIHHGMDKHGVLRVRYVTKNPNAPAIFYQCADVAIF